MTTWLSGEKNRHHAAAGRRRRKMREALTGYLFTFPATLVTFVFGLWPVIAGFYESLKSGSPLTNRYVGLDNYTRSLGSFTYIALLALCVIFVYLAYRAWRGIYLHHQQQGGLLWPYLLPAYLAAVGLIIMVFNLVTGSQAYTWLPVVLLLAAVGGFLSLETFQQPPTSYRRRLVTIWALLGGIGIIGIAGPALMPDGALGTLGWFVLVLVLLELGYRLLPYLGRVKGGQIIGSSITMALFMLLAILLARYAIIEMENEVAEAQEVASLIFNQHVLDGTIEVAEDNLRIEGLTVDGEVMVQVMINGETLEAPLAPDAFGEMPVEKIARLEIALMNNEKVPVVLPDGTLTEGQITGLKMGQTLAVGLQAGNAQIVRDMDIYSGLEVGEGVIQAGGHTEPLDKQVYAALAVFVGIAAIYTMSSVRSRLDDELNPRQYRWLHIGRIGVGFAVGLLFLYLVGSVQLNRQAAGGLSALSEEQFKWAYEFVTGSAPRATLRAEVLAAQLLYWPQVFLVSTGALLIGVAYLVWHSAQKRETQLGFGLTIGLAILLMIGGWMTISELPRTISLAGREAEDTFKALVRTAMYSAGTVPVQLVLGLFLAYLLFSEVTWGKSFFRVVYFMPYIAPSVATSTVFLVIFSLNENSLANQALGLLGIEPMQWLKEPAGIVRLFYQHVLGGNPLNIPSALQGPSLALFTIILYNIWVFAGYNAVVFLAGLGAIPGELYEAAEVDGAGRWPRFRHITLPLLSPTTFFLTMLSVIGTFKAFSHIYVLRNRATGKEIDTMSVHIFQTLYSANDPGYAAALAFMLFGIILILTLIQNRLAREQVFYG